MKQQLNNRANKCSIETLLNILNDCLGYQFTLDQIDEDLAVAGIDSVALIQIIIVLENIYNITIPDEYLIFSQINTLRKIHQKVLEQVFNESKRG